MNLKNFPKKLDSKTSCLRITVPENLDLALEGLIRKVLREQPKVDDIYAFAADYFDMLLKIRDKVGTKFAADQLCPFHNDEDAHEMIKLANVFAKPENLKTKIPEVQKTKSIDTNARGKELSRLTGKSGKATQNDRHPVATRKKPERLTPHKKKGEKSNEAKPERPTRLKLEPKTEDVGDDEEFLKSDAIKLLVEKELMDAGKSQPKDGGKEKKDGTGAQQTGKPEEAAAANEELCAVVDKDYVKTEAKEAREITSKANEEKVELRDATKSGKEGENEAIKETLQSAKDATTEETTKELQVDTKAINEEIKTGTQDDNVEIKTENDRVKSIESSAGEEETRDPLKNKPETNAQVKDVKLREAPKETSEAQEGKSLEEKMELEGIGKSERAIKEEAEERAENKITKEPSSVTENVSPNPEELSSEADISNTKPPEKEESDLEKIKEAEGEEQNLSKGEGISEVKIKTEEMLNNEKKENEWTQKSVKAFEEPTESGFANKAEEANNLISPNERKAQHEQENSAPEKVKVTDEASETTKSAEISKMEIEPGDNKSDDEATIKEEEIKKTDPEEIEPLPSEDQKQVENLKGVKDNEIGKTSEVIGDERVSEETTVTEEAKTATEKEKSKVAEERFELKDKPTDSSENKEPPEKAEMAKESEAQPESKETKSEIKADEPLQNDEKAEDKKLGEVNSVGNNQKAPEEPFNITEERTNLVEVTEQPKVEEKLQNEELKPKEEIEIVKEVEDKMEVSREENICDKQKEKNDGTEVVKETGKVEKADNEMEARVKDSEKEKLETVQESIKPIGEWEKAETVKINAVDSTDAKDTNQIPQQLTEGVAPNITGEEMCTVVDSQHTIQVEEAEKLPEENLSPEGVQIKTIQTHYYNTLQVPEQVTKEYRVHSVENGNMINNLLGTANVIPSSDKEQDIEIPVPTLDLPKQDDQELLKKDLEDSLVTPSSNYSLNLSELSVQTISEMFLDSEKQYSAMEREERVHVTKTGEKCGDEGHVEKQEVEEIIHKTTVPSSVKATPVAPRDETEVNEESNVEPSLKEEKQEPSDELNEQRDSSNEGRSVDSDTPIISVEVKTVIETQSVEDEVKEKDGGGLTGGDESDVQIRIEAVIDVPEGMIVDVREEKEYKDEVRQHASDEPSASETVPKNSRTSSGESESTISSTATEIKRNDSTKRHFSSTRTLITTQSLDYDKRNPLLKTRSLSSFRQGVIDFEVWNAIEKELEEAATKIQSNFRGYKTRKKLQRENAVQITTEESSCSTTPVEPEPELREERQQGTGEFHDSIVLSEHPR